MGVGGISIWQLLIILVIVLLLFGTKRLKSIGSDLGNAVKGFRNAMSDSDKAEEGQESEGAQRTLETRSAEGDRVATSVDPKAVQERSRESR